MGGKAFEGITQRIQKDDVCGTLTWLTNNWTDSALQGGSYMDHLLGSAAKNDTSGDLDLNLDITLFDQAKVAKDLTDLLGAENVKARPGHNQIFTAVPILGNAELYGRVQVDFMFGDYEWQKFSYFSPSYTQRVNWGNRSGSAFKGLYRTEFIKAMVAYNSSWVLEEADQVVARVGPTFFHDRGLVWRYRHRPMRQDGTARVKDFQEITRDEFMALYPSAIPAPRETLNDPDEVAKFILSPSYTKDHCQTLEQLAAHYRSVYHRNQQDTIQKIFVERLNSLKVSLMPAEMSRIYLHQVK